MLQDSQGFMWFGTEDGLNKYDGYTFTVYKHDPEDPYSLSDNWIQAMLEDASGTLWIGTRENGLERYDRNLDQFTHFRNDPEDPSSLSDDEITAIYQDRDGVLWIGTGGGGLDRYDQENERFIHYQHDPDDPHSLSSNVVSTIYKDREGVLWIGTADGGLNRFESENERWWHDVNDPSDPHSLRHNTITAISEDQSGALWVGTGGGGLDKLVVSHGDANGFIHYQHDPDDPDSLSSDDISAIYQDREGVLWIGTRGGGLNRLDPDKETFDHYQNDPGDPHSLSFNVVMSIFQDREGVLWFGTIGGGVNKLDVGRWNFAHYKNDPNDPNSLGDNMVRAFFQDREGALWIGTMAGGLDRFDRENDSWRHYRHDPDDPGSLSNDWVSAIYGDRSGVLWIGTASGLDSFDPETETFTHYTADPNGSPGSLSNNVRTIYEGQAAEFWIGTKGGLYRFDRDETSWSHHYHHDPGDPHSLSNDWVLSFREDQDGVIWIGTWGGGLNRFDPEKETFDRYQNNPGNPHSLSNNLVNSIFQDREGALWISTPGGLDKFDQETETFTHYREKDGLPNDSIYCVAADGQGHLWLSTNKGLSRFDPQRETFTNYDVTDGLQSNEFNGNACFVSDSEEMFFGGINGFNTFFPDHVQDNPTIPPVVLTSLAQDEEEVDLGIAFDSVTEVTLKWPDNSFEFEFAALSYAQPEKNQYTYMLEGFDEDWNEIGTRRYGKYTNLPGGTYTLHLRGSNNDGVWNEAGTAVQVTIVPPFWGTWWFRVIGLVVLLMGTYGVYRLRVRNLEARGRDLELLVEQRTAELMQTEEALRQSDMEEAIAAERNRLARNLHDSVSQTVFSMTLTAEAARILFDRDAARAASELDKLQALAKSALAEMRSLVFELRPTAVTEKGLIPALRHHMVTLDRLHGLVVALCIEGEPHLTDLEARQLYRVIQEALNNVVKHARTDRASVALQFEDARVLARIEDEGQGFAPGAVGAEGQRIGLSTMRERVEMLGGTLTIDSSPGAGTRVTVELVPVSGEGSNDKD